MKACKKKETSWYKDKKEKYFGVEENEAVKRIIKKNAVPPKQNFFDYYE